MVTSFVVVPQWQGSGSARAMRLVDGAKAIGADLPSTRTHAVPVPLEAGDALGTRVHRLSSLTEIRNRHRRVLADADGSVVTIGGDCGVELAAIDHALLRHPDAAILWFDAHPDLNTPESSPSGAFGGMVLRTLLGDGPAELLPERTASVERLALVGVRDIDPEESAFIDAHALPTIPADGLVAEQVVERVAAMDVTSVYIHIDLDVLDLGEITGLTAPQPFGMQTSALLEVVRALTAKFEVAGAGIASFAPASAEQSADDMPTLLRLIGALTRRD
ncbi:arginase family protein [Diaminobutyricimonas sp. LJ205]|uniref:arginase family protein n=1 Tax=Diaminobutyricimonas sp. LJ205 TaxID=2683590 RepID=UPI0012F4D4A8|nr:arginase family protein [Diaminobutyricimonas sp. LJ205]